MHADTRAQRARGSRDMQFLAGHTRVQPSPSLLAALASRGIWPSMWGCHALPCRTSLRSESARPRSANLVGQYVEKPAMPTKAASDATTTTRPLRLRA